MLECNVERVEGIEPSTKAWEAFVLPLNYTRSERLTLYHKMAAMRSFILEMCCFSSFFVLLIASGTLTTTVRVGEVGLALKTRAGRFYCCGWRSCFPYRENARCFPG